MIDNILKLTKDSIKKILEEFGIIDKKNQERLISKLNNEINIELSTNQTQIQKMKINIINENKNLKYELLEIKLESCELKLKDKIFQEEPRFDEIELLNEFEYFNLKKLENKKLNKLDFVNMITSTIPEGYSQADLFLKYGVKKNNVKGYNQKVNYCNWNFNNKELIIIRNWCLQND